jgi:glycolate oxidase FAD binding subunit
MTGLPDQRPADDSDVVDGVAPRVIEQPGSPEALAGALARLSRARRSTLLRGGGTKLGWGRVPAALDVIVDTGRLDQLVAHRHGDMTATAQAGMRLSALNRALAAHGQYLPVESAFEGTTVGGMVATNESGPLRHRFGTPRDLLIGVTLAMTDGRIVKAGGTVVKNVAGYDLGRLVSGSFGGLAAIVDATFKLLPLPRTSMTVRARYGDLGAVTRDVAAIAGSQIEPAAFDLRMSEASRAEVLIRVASSPAATEAQIAEARRLLSVETSVVSGEAEQALWCEQVRAPWTTGAVVVRLSWRPSDLGEVLTLVGQSHERVGATLFSGRVSGVGMLSLNGGDEACAAAVARLRSTSVVGHVVVLQASAAFKALVDVWGPGAASAGVASRLKRMFDPEGVLGAGRGPIT